MDNYRPEVKAALDDLLLGMPGVKGGKAFGYPAYKINGRIFMFVGGAGITFKLPLERVADVIASHPQARQFEVSDGVLWRQWVEIDHDDPAQYAADLPLLEESALYVASQ
jgi:hypothetical protein